MRSASAASFGSWNSVRSFARLSVAISFCPPFFDSSFFAFFATTSERIFADASVIRSEIVVASILNMRPDSCGSSSSIATKVECSITYASTVPSATTETPGTSPRRSDISPIRSPFPRFATSFALPSLRSETLPFLMKYAASDVCPSVISFSPDLYVETLPTLAKSFSRNCSLFPSDEFRNERRPLSSLAPPPPPPPISWPPTSSSGLEDAQPMQQKSFSRRLCARAGRMAEV